ncbi:enoyl-CoA delta isomerase 2, mitochondrial-like [Trichoplusia ni]|uniref:Enoyl-CoA delta isomerase 2, mitochondrial-like n=1 Tax=Trichoplusia ni TaxID=7111 RepID=A0A7E5WDC3_TRINI|nr:enoyl-CoA delta isomerase 2, mitochondrial-like [Trichoplusia ni]XP_026738180.1 enoyl-CoA delta isomerase 2, mitochondrial-like [Trichoplusia ni]XP_026738181.1 enoyl-CoA delta isomerase 2, mitochondrial-like [Trichoplusia ni]XP_026738184.1 enoyl-CoA delta isomerase 2, mitochondrial-like [Trichoplusia ni]XP_026738185.1 enoyl-CoA delta isomerase 2, mitochondrial-like [Trichoplusia ni]
MNIKETVIESHQGGIKIVQYNRPHKKNAIDPTMYLRLINIFNETAIDDSISVMVLTGAGDFYSSGNDFSVATDMSKGLNVLKEYINAFIMFPKILVAIVNGPAIGIAATTLALCDLVFASENSYFYTPFTKLGIVAEGCSTFTFPRLIGDRKATEMLLCNHRMTAKEALECGFINDIYKPEELQSKVWDKITEVSKLPPISVAATKKLLRDSVRQELLKANDIEIQELNSIWVLKSKL